MGWLRGVSWVADGFCGTGLKGRWGCGRWPWEGGRAAYGGCRYMTVTEGAAGMSRTAGLSEVKVDVRRRAAERRSRLRAERAKRDREIGALAERVMVRIGRRNVAELEAGMLIEDLAGLGLANEDIAEWCDVPAREVVRLRQVAKANMASEVPEGASGA